MVIDISEKEKTDIKPRCYFCKAEVTECDFCYGCGQYVCEECEEYPVEDRPCGKHKVEDHRKVDEREKV